MTQPIRIAVLISGSGSNLQAIINHQKLHSELYTIVQVISNKPNAFGLERAQKAGIKHQVIDHTQFSNRETFDAALQNVLDKSMVDLVVLAGFMRILTEGFTRHFLGRMLNIHPSLLPKYTGLNTHQRAIEAGDSEHGLSVHFVTPELDEGPAILQAKVCIEIDDNVESLQNKVHLQEHLAYPLVIQWFAEGRLTFQNGQAWFDQKPLKCPLLLNDF
ncbi:MAG: phosphoribosylglycinamide formyltransferase [Thiotrichales bacterium]|nr:phosphoribosylglycinamide formyltransferase [Thiotrichales bacterium]